MRNVFLGAVATVVLASASQAATFTANLTFTDPVGGPGQGLNVRALTLRNSGPQAFVSSDLTFDLVNVGDTFFADIFVIRTTEPSIERDDLALKSFELLVKLAMFGNGSVSGNTYGSSGDMQFGVMDFLNDAVIQVGDGLAITVSLGDVIFNAGVGLLTPGKSNGAVVGAKFTLTEFADPALAALTAVPVPAAAPLALTAFGALAMFGRRRKRG